MSDNILGLVISAAFVLLLGAVWLWARWKRAEVEKSWPKVWTHLGLPPPPGVEKALAIIAKHTPGMPQAGYIEWVPKPFSIGWTLAAGTVASTRPIHIVVLYNDLVEKTALVHECGHVWSELTKQGFGESPADTRFVLWFTSINAEIAKELGR